MSGLATTKILPVDNVSATNSKTAAANTPVVITFPAVANHRTLIVWVSWSYSDDPTGGALTIAYGANTVFQVNITKGGPGVIPFPDLPTNINEAAVITLAAGGGVIVGKLNVYGRKEYLPTTPTNLATHVSTAT